MDWAHRWKPSQSEGRKGSGDVETICCHVWPFMSDITFVGDILRFVTHSKRCLSMRVIYVDMYGLCRYVECHHFKP
jgi:hypothetical protein